MYNKNIIENPLYYKGYEELGDALIGVNVKQAFLCYENALFYCDANDATETLRNKLDEVIKIGGFVAKTSIVILNYNRCEMTRDCIESIRNTVPKGSYDIIIVDNASTDSSVAWLREQEDIQLIENSENAGFPKGCNQGIAVASKENDVLLLNNDTIMCANTLFWLKMALYENDMHGLAGSFTNYCVDSQKIHMPSMDRAQYEEYAKRNNVTCDNYYEYRFFVSGFCMLIRRNVIDDIGGLDEQFGKGYYEDNDYSLRAIESGYQCIVVHNSFLIHWGTKTFSNSEGLNELYMNNRKIFECKHPVKCADYNVEDVVYYCTKRIEYIDKVRSMLVVNCGIGKSLLRIKWENPNIDIWGCDSSMQASIYGTKQISVNIRTFHSLEQLNIPNRTFEYVILDFRDVNIEEVGSYFKKIKKYLDKESSVISIVPNRKFYANWINMAIDGESINCGDVGIKNANGIDNIISENGYYVQRWSFMYSYPYDQKIRSAIEKFGKMLEPNCQDIFVGAYAIFAGLR